MIENLQAVAAVLELTRDHIVTLARNSFEAAFVTAAEKRAMLARLDDYLAENGEVGS